MYKVKVYLDSYSGDDKSDVGDLLHQWVFSWHKTAVACTTLKRLQLKHNKKTMKHLVQFAQTYETIRSEEERKEREELERIAAISKGEKGDNRDLGSAMSMNKSID